MEHPKEKPEVSKSRRTRGDEQITCPFCGTSPEDAYNWKQRPCVRVRPGWINCPCLGPNDQHIDEEQMRRAEENVKKRQRADIRQVFWEESQGRFNKDAYKGETKDKEREKYLPVDIRIEQEWQGWADPELVEIERIERQSVPIQSRVPKWVKNRIDRVAEDRGMCESTVMRWVIEENIHNLEQVEKVAYGTARKPFRFYLSPCNARMWRSLRDKTFETSDADLITALVAAQFGRKKKQ